MNEFIFNSIVTIAFINEFIYSNFEISAGTH